MATLDRKPGRKLLLYTMKEAYSLSERHERVLALVTEKYIETAAPVGSRTVAKKFLPPLSPATIRNVMADLEELGLLSQPHTSAGRIPTEEGFRYYVEHLLDPEPLPEETLETIERNLSQEEIAESWETLLKSVSHLLSDLSGFPVIVTAPKLEYEKLIKIDFVRLSERLILTVAVSASGMVIHRLIKTLRDFSIETLERLSALLNDRLPGLTLKEVREVLFSELQNEKALLEDLLLALCESPEEPFVEGINRLLDLPEFQDLERLKEILKTFEEKSLLLQLIDRCLEARTPQVLIGAPSPQCPFKQCGAIVASYSWRDTPVGGVAIIGPMRMAYARLIPLVEYTTQHLSRTLDKLSPRT
ncbi:heat-inducible transcriptional repressor HrcA [Thermosulfurimonas dismutans]|nr:heat-inducible transcriptional repressor HrcA [Thermosulfurimonas dismutans]